MCGICGIFRTDRLPVDQERVLRMRDSMIYRGPDGCGLLAGSGFALGHRRLSIIDLSDCGRQPMSNEDGSVHLVFNGEIYNFLDLRPELDRAGHQFRSRTDSEVLIHGYEQWGIEGLLKRIRGMYAFAIVDARRHEIHLARDPLGKKPLFYRWSDGELLFASSARALTMAMTDSPEIDAQAIDDLLWNRCIGDDCTIFQNVAKLPPGRALSFLANGEMKEIVHWRPNFFEHDTGVSADEWLEKIDAALRTAVRRRLVADVPVGVMLSGGVDSGLVAALAAETAGRIRTYCVASEDLDQDESDYARAVAERYNTEHHLLSVRSNVRADLPRLVASMGEPLADISAANLFAISQVARESVTVVLTGDGGDEAFGGYTDFWAAHQAERFQRIVPRWLCGLSANLVEPLRRGPRLLRRAGSLLRIAALPLEESIGGFQVDGKLLRDSLYTNSFVESLHGRTPRDRTRELLVGTTNRSWCDRIMQSHVQTVLADDFLPKVDVATMGASLEARCPFLDLDLFELAMRIPTTMRLADNQPKGLLRRLARRYLPAKGVNRSKQGFSAPIGLWFRESWGDLTKEFILGPHVERRGWFQRRTLERVASEHQSGRNHGNLLWSLLVLEIWLRLSVDRTLAPGDVL